MKRKITFEVDSLELFDALAKNDSAVAALGGRLIGVMLDPSSIGFSTEVGLAYYGISVIEENHE